MSLTPSVLPMPPALPMSLMPPVPLMLPMPPALLMSPMPPALPMLLMPLMLPMSLTPPAPGKRRAAPGGPPKLPLRKKTCPCDGKNHPKHVQ